MNAVEFDQSVKIMPSSAGMDPRLYRVGRPQGHLGMVTKAKNNRRKSVRQTECRREGHAYRCPRRSRPVFSGVYCLACEPARDRSGRAA